MSALGDAFRRLPPPIYGFILEKLGRHDHYYPFGFAMNGQVSRLEVVRQIIYACAIQEIIETGTYRGTTTEWLSSFGLPVTTIEGHPQTHAFARRRLSRHSNVVVRFGNSADDLPRVLQTAPKEPIFFYLDAHWEDHLPLAEELSAIKNCVRSAIILIDDFQVPSDGNYSYDDYGAGKALTPAYIQPFIDGGMTAFYPATAGDQETGARRGWVVLGLGDAVKAQLRTMSLLREF